MRHWKTYALLLGALVAAVAPIALWLFALRRSLGPSALAPMLAFVLVDAGIVAALAWASRRPRYD